MKETCGRVMITNTQQTAADSSFNLVKNERGMKTENRCIPMESVRTTVARPEAHS